MVETRELIETGRRQFQSRNYAKASQCFQKALRLGVRYADVYNMLGLIYHQEGKFNDAIDCLQKALKVNPNYAEANLNLAVLYNDLGHYTKAKRLYRQVQSGRKGLAKINPTMKAKIANMHAQIGDTYSRIGLFTEAIDEHRKALALCPTFRDIKTKLGICYRENSQTDLSLKELRETVKHFPNYTPARLQLGLTHYTGGQLAKATREWETVLKKDKDNPLAKMYLRISRNNHKKAR